MSTYSQPTETLQCIEDSLARKHMQKLKSIYHHEDEKLHCTLDNQTKKLPFNFFLSPTQYHKMLITKGKNRKKGLSQGGDLITTLQYHNDPIFQRQIRRQNAFKQTIKAQAKQSISLDHKMDKLTQSEIKKIKSTIQYDNSLYVNQKYSINSKLKKKNVQYNKQSRKTHSTLNKSRNNKSKLKDQNVKNKSFSKMSESNKRSNIDISHLLIKSLVEFNQKKKTEKLVKKSREKSQRDKQKYLQILNQKIRAYNLQFSRRSKSKSKDKSLTKHDLAINYWEQIKDQVLSSLKNDFYSQPLKNQLKNYSFNIYDHKEIPERQFRLTREQIEYLRAKHQEQANTVIKEKQKQRRSVSQKIKKNLKTLEKERKRRIEQTLKKPFQPTANMIRTAFQNLVEQNNQNQNSTSFSNSKSLFKNQSIRKSHVGSKKQNVKR